IIAMVAALTALAPRLALACASCGCGDPTLTVMGSETPFAGRIRASLEARTADAVVGAGADREVTRDSRVDLGFSSAPLDRLVLAAGLPLVMRSTQAADLPGESAIGPGDLELSARFVLLRDRPLAPRHLLSVVAGAGLPTGLQTGGMDVTPGSGAFVPLG